MHTIITKVHEYIKSWSVNQITQLNENETRCYMMEAFYKTLVKIDIKERMEIVSSKSGVKLTDFTTSQDSKCWRNDQKMLEGFVALILSFSKHDLAKDSYPYLLPIFIEGFFNVSWTNRIYCVDQLAQVLPNINDEKWIADTLIDTLTKNVSATKNYEVRITSLYALRNVILVVSAPKLRQ